MVIEMNKTYCGDSLLVLKTFPDNFIDCCVTSPPYWGLRDYGVSGQIGMEETPDRFVQALVNVFGEVRRVLKPEGTLWLNLGDSYAGSGKGPEGNLNKGAGFRHLENITVPFKSQSVKPKDLIGIPWMVAFALRNSGWWLRQDLIWHKPNPMPESVTDRCTKAHEYIFLLSKSAKYYYDYEALQEIATGFDGRKDTLMKGSNKYKTSVVPGMAEHTMAAQGHERWKFKGTGTFGNRNGELKGLHSGNKYNPKFKNLQPDGQQPNTIHTKRGDGQADEVYPIRNKRSVWTVNTKPYLDAHFATFPPELIVDCIKAGCPEDGIVLDPFNGSGTTRIVAEKLGRNSIGIELNPKYIQIENRRRKKELGMFEKIAS